MILRWPFAGTVRPPSAAATPDCAALVELRGVTKRYRSAGGDVAALQGIDLQIAEGEFIVVLGKSGAGKTTLANLISGIDAATAGEIHVVGVPLHALGEDRRAVWRGRHVGVVLQFFQLLPGLTVLQNVMLPMDFADRCPPRQQRARAMLLLEQMGIADHAGKLPSAMSGGQQQRAAIARALANDPPVVVADEPTGNLDSATARAVFSVFLDLAHAGKTILMVTHDRDLAAQAGRRIVLADGAIVEDSGRC